MNSENSYRIPASSKSRIAFRGLLNYSSTALLLFIFIKIFPQLGHVQNSVNAIGIMLAVTAVNLLVWPVFIISVLGLFPKIYRKVMLTAFPIIFLILPAIVVDLAGRLFAGLVINGFGPALLVALLMSIISSIFASIFAADDGSLIYQLIINRTGFKSALKEDANKPGIVFLEIDGLGSKALQDAMNTGNAPNMKRWADDGSHKLVAWESDLSSQTSAAQAGILHGNNFSIPAFRWYDKKTRTIIVSSSIKDITQIEKQISDGKGLLSRGGAARATLLSGDASRVLMIASKAFDVDSTDLREYYAYFLNPANVLRSLSLMVWDWVLEKKAAWGQRLRNEKPRVNRGGLYFIFRSLATIILRDLSLYAVKVDMYSGVPYIFVALVGYDEVSHHSGITRRDTLDVLFKLDRELGKLEKVAKITARKYKLVVLSDHGQTQGTTFKERYSESLVDVVSRFVNEPVNKYKIAGYGTKHESAYYIDAALRDYRLSNSKLGKRIENRVGSNQQFIVGKEEKNDIVVLASGNLGLISFTNIEHRLTLEEIIAEFPHLLTGLVEHPGVGFVMVHSNHAGAVALGKKGRIHLSTGEVNGENPLLDYGQTAQANLIRTDSFPNAPDILVIGRYWKDTDEVAAFEEQVGSHGGIGGQQSKPFILFPHEFQLETDRIVGAEAVNKILKRWINEVR